MRGSLRSASGALSLAALATGCLDSAPPPREPVFEQSFETRGMTLESACTPTGPESCFDATDDNCNGAIDEGCGLHTGILQFTVAWQAAEADVDLNVTDAGGQLAGYEEPTAGGLRKDRDCPGTSGDCHGQNVENVYLAGGEPRAGTYRVVVRLDKLNGASPPVRVRLGVRILHRSFRAVFDLAPGPGTDEKELRFAL